MRITDITRRTMPVGPRRRRQALRFGVALVASLMAHSPLLTWVAVPRPSADRPLMVRLAEESSPTSKPTNVLHRNPPPAVSPATAAAPPRMPMTEIARDILRADAERQRRQQQERSFSTRPPSVMFNNLKDERFTPAAPSPSPTGLSTYTTNAGLIVYRRVGRDGKVSCMTLRPADPNNEYDHGAIYLWSLDFDAKHAKRGGC